jgi:hypothetical protein
MSLKDAFRAHGPVLIATSLSAILGLAGCSLFRSSPASVRAASQGPAPAEVTTDLASEPQTVTEALADLPPDADTTTVISNAAPALRAGAPKNYTVRRGDTLWGISNMFLRDPWLWPEIWFVNPEIRNPHRIYPGDTVRLAAGSNGQTALQVVRGPSLYGARLEPMLRGAPLEAPIATVPYSVISAFLSHPGVLSREQVKAAPYVVALPGDHQIAGSGDDVYVKKLAGELGARYSVMHVDEPLINPDNGRRLGFLAIYTGTAELTRPGPVAKATLTASAREALEGDVLIAEDNSSSQDILPHPPARPISAQVIAVVDNVLLAGQWEVVALNRGARDGLERGTVLTAEQGGARVVDRCARIENASTCLHHPSLNLPSENSGTLLVFKTYDQMSYALILSEEDPIQVHDRVRNP